MTEKHEKLWRQTFTGRRVNPTDIKPSDVHILDIAHHLAFQNRYGGSLHGYESIAEHSVLMAMHAVSQHGVPVARFVLMHDAAEAYIQDINRPLKKQLYIKRGERFISFSELDAEITETIYVALGLNLREVPHAIIDQLDARIVRNEAQAGMIFDPEWMATRKSNGPDVEDRLPFEVQFWSPERAEKEFLRLFNKLWGSW